MRKVAGLGAHSTYVVMTIVSNEGEGVAGPKRIGNENANRMWCWRNPGSAHCELTRAELRISENDAMPRREGCPTLLSVCLRVAST